MTKKLNLCFTCNLFRNLCRRAAFFQIFFSKMPIFNVGVEGHVGSA